MHEESDQIAQESLEADSFLCEQCSKINLNEILSLKSISFMGRRIFEFRSASEMVRNPNCSFCQAFDFINPTRFVKSGHYWCPDLVAVHSRNPRTKGDMCDMDVLPEDSIFLTTESEGLLSRIWRMETVPYLFPTPGCLGLPTALKEGDFFMADSIGSTVDFNMVRSWIKNCEKKHGDYCAPSSTQNSTLRLIECNSRKVVATPRSPEISTYAALSYVWGSQEPDEVCSEELPKQLPKTIEDAIIVTKGLGIPYLWIDRYCINQADDNEKHGQCGLMHKIYEGAHITIIAAAGSGPDHGLPGIGSSIRSYPSVRVGSRLLVPTLPDPRLSIQAAKWSSRGWTYQESQLSKRRLIFTERQVLFVCRRACTDEAEQKQNPDTELPDEVIRANTSLSPFCISEQSPRTIWSEINQFIKLDLSHEEDCLNAMLGILQRYQELNWMYGYVLRHLAGLPAVKGPFDYERPGNNKYSTWTNAIFKSLVWTTMETAERRDVPHPGFPSWSWTGWKAAEYCDPDRWELCYRHTFHRSQSIFVEHPDGCLVKGNELDSLLEAGHDFSRIRFIHLKVPSLNFTLFSVKFPHHYSRFGYMRSELNKVCVVRHHDADFLVPFEVTDSRLRIPEDGFHCWGIMISEMLESGGLPSLSSPEILFLLVTKVEDWYERIGVAKVTQPEVLQEHEVRTFRLG